MRTERLQAVRLLLPAFLIMFLLAISGRAQAQSTELDPETAGTEYIIAFPDTLGTVGDARYPNPQSDSIGLFIFSGTDSHINTVWISGPGFADTVEVRSLNFDVVHLNRAQSASIFLDSINTPLRKTFRVRSLHPIILYCVVATKAGVEGWTPIPVERWGREYHVSAAPNDVVVDLETFGRTEIGQRPKSAPGEIVVIAAEDNTTVRITPPFGVLFAGFPSSKVTLNAGEAYQLKVFESNVADKGPREHPTMDATVIIANKPIGVISGNARAQVDNDDVGLANNIYKNLLIEWLAPVEQYGTEFVFMPSFDQFRPGSGGTVEGKREYAHLYSSRCASMLFGYLLRQESTTEHRLEVGRDDVNIFSFGTPQAGYIKTESPAQAMMFSSAIVKFNGSTPCADGIPCLSYDAWAPYMTEIVPREQWTTFAPYYVPSTPDQMVHYINVVTDTLSAQSVMLRSGSPFVFNRRIAGTDLVWGSMAVPPGGGFIYSPTGARFHAFIYGFRKGSEEYKPGTTVKTAELIEVPALAYGYPLAPGRRKLREACALSSVERPDVTTTGSRLQRVPSSSSDRIELRYTIDTPGSMKLEVYNAIGERVAPLIDREAGAGTGSVLWDASSVPAGIYYCRLVTTGHTDLLPIVVRR